MNSLENLGWMISSGYLSNQYLIASIPSSCVMLEYSDSTSNVARILSFVTSFGRWFKKSVVSLILLLTLFVSGLKMMSNVLLNLCVKQLGPATIGLNFKSVTFLTFTVDESECLHALFMLSLLWTFGKP